MKLKARKHQVSALHLFPRYAYYLHISLNVYMSRCFENSSKHYPMLDDCEPSWNCNPIIRANYLMLPFYIWVRTDYVKNNKWGCCHRMTSHRESGRIWGVVQTLFNGLRKSGKNALSKCDITMSHTRLVVTQHCDKSWYHLSWITCLPLHIIPIFRHVMLNDNATKWFRLPLSLTIISENSFIIWSSW